jgi:hypothetical protein
MVHQDAGADLWAIGITAFELVNGDVPFGVDASEVYGKLDAPDPVGTRSDRPHPSPAAR